MINVVCFNSFKEKVKREKDDLRRVLRSIFNKYEITQEGVKYLGAEYDVIDIFVGCLHNRDLKKYLLEKDICPSFDELPEKLIDFKDAKSIMFTFRNDMEFLCDDLGFYKLKKGVLKGYNHECPF